MIRNSHLANINESYFQHMRHALSFTFEMFVGALCCLIHAIFPSLFEDAGSQIINRLHDRMVVNRAKLSSREEAAPEHESTGASHSS